MSGRAIMRPCSHPGCPALTTGGPCPTHARQREHRRDNYAVRRWYRTAKWQAIRRRVLHEEPCCPDCQQETGRVVESQDVHHKQRHGGDRRRFFDRRNLQALCHVHHARRTARGE